MSKFDIIAAIRKANEDANELQKTDPVEAKKQYEADRWVLEQSGWSDEQRAAYFGQTTDSQNKK